jgi:hypothetical protein
MNIKIPHIPTSSFEMLVTFLIFASNYCVMTKLCTVFIIKNMTVLSYSF